MSNEELAKNIMNFFSSDMGMWFDEIQGNEEECYFETLRAIENVDNQVLSYIINTIEDYLSSVTNAEKYIVDTCKVLHEIVKNHKS